MPFAPGHDTEMPVILNLPSLALLIMATVSIDTAPAEPISADPSPVLATPFDPALPRDKTRTRSLSEHGIRYHNGPVLTSGISVYYLWYGKWNGDAAVPLVENVALYLGGTSYWNINSTYTDRAGRQVTPDVRLGGSAVDSYSQGTSLSTSGVFQAITRAIENHALPFDENGVYILLSSADVTIPGFCTTSCAWHTSWPYIQGSSVRNIHFSWIGDTRTCPLRCGAQSTTPNNSVAGDGMANMVARQLSGIVTNPTLTGWYSDGMIENSEKCKWDFGPAVQLDNGSLANVQLGSVKYYLQRNWVNAKGGYCALSLDGLSVTSALPNSGPAGSTTVMTIRGSGFAPGTVVEVSGSGVAVSNLNIVSPGEMRVTMTVSPSAMLGAREVRVLLKDAMASLPFTIVQPLAPTVTSLLPSLGAVGTTVPLVISGSNFSPTASLSLVGQGVSLANVRWINSTRIEAQAIVAPTADYGPRLVSVTSGHASSGGVAFTVITPPRVVSFAPQTGSGMSQVFTVGVQERAGAPQLRLVSLSVDRWVKTAGSCLINVMLRERTLSMLNDAGTAWSTVPIGSGALLSNGQCSVAPAMVQISQSDATTIRISVPIAFTAQYTGLKSVFVNSNNTSLLETGFAAMGTYAVQDRRAPEPIQPPQQTAPRQPPSVVSVTPGEGVGLSETFTISVEEASGTGNLRLVTLAVDGWVKSQNSCLLNIFIQSRTVSLLNDAGSSWSSGAISSSATLGNSQCSLALAGVQVSQSSATRSVVRVAVVFKPVFVGAKKVFVNANNGALLEAGFKMMGQFTVRAVSIDAPTTAPRILSISPREGSGVGETFVVTVDEASGVRQLRLVTLVIDGWVKGVNSCLINVLVQERSVSLLNDSGVGWSTGLLGSGATLGNSQCSLALSGAQMTEESATSTTVRLPITFRPSYVGTKQVFVNANNTALLEAGFRSLGSFAVVPQGVQNPTEPPRLLSSSPANGVGKNGTFELVVEERSGSGNLRLVTLAVDSWVKGQNSCLVNTFIQSGLVSLMNDSGTSWVSGQIGASGVLRNSQCSLALSDIRLSHTSGTSTRLVLPLVFGSGYSGLKTVFVNMNNTALLEAGFRDVGTFDIR